MNANQIEDHRALQMLATQPLEFLRKNSLTTYAMPDADAGLHMFYMLRDVGRTIQRPGSRLGNLNPHGGQRFTVRSDNIYGGIPFHAIHIPVQPSNVVFNTFTLRDVGANLMLTTQLTGCSVVIVPNGGTYEVAHLQPTGETGEQLRTRLSALQTYVYGVTDYTPGRAVVLGVRLGGQWCFYAQNQDGYHNVTSVSRLQP
ncbi:MAG TPA: hypothetical protein VIU64_14475 [Polyangia bacterium]